MTPRRSTAVPQPDDGTESPGGGKRAQASKIRRALKAGLSDHQAGRLDKAEAAYRSILAIDPTHADALHLLGVVAHQCGRPGPALKLIEAALPALVDLPDAHLNYGNVLRDLGRLQEACASYRRALGLDSDNAMAHNNLARALIEQGLPDAALASARRAADLLPGFAPAHVNCAGALLGLARWAEAEAALRQALAIDPAQIHLQLDLGYALQQQKRLDEAIDVFHDLTVRCPTLAEAHNNLGNALREKGRRADTITAYGAALRLAPGQAGIHYNFAKALRDDGRYDDAIASYRNALSHRPGDVAVWYELGSLLAERRRLTEAALALSRAAPTIADAAVELLWTRRRMCDWTGYDAAEANVRQTEGAQVFALMNLNSTMQEQRAWADRAAARLIVPTAARFSTVAPKFQERLRIGYVSANFRRHAGASLIAGLIEAHDRARFEIIGYSAGPDDGSENRARLSAAFDRFTDISGLGDGDAASLIHRDGIDILVDLNGHTSGSRIGLFAYRPAPIQVSYLGFPGTTGAEFLDYIVADRFVVPPEHQPLYREQVVFLPHAYQCNDDRRPIAARTPSREACGLPPDGFVFCCLNNPAKITPDMFAVWKRILLASPGSVLWLLDDNEWARANLAREAAAHGVVADRIIFAPHQPSAEHLARHRVADLFLDTLPYSAHTSASDALWAGLPVLTCVGETFAGRVAGSLLHAIGLPELLTSSLAEYEALACSLFRDRPRLNTLRERLVRNRLVTPLFDTRGFARDLEAAYRQMWTRWVDGEPAASFAVEGWS